jgi:phage terminase large subunit
MYFTCNPGGVGHAWVKRLFIDGDYREGEKAEDYVFIPSTVYDNRYLIEENPEYVRTLESLPPLRRRAMLDGDWDAFEGQYFTEFDRSRHEIAPFAIPDSWHRFAALDYGLDMTACLWFAYPPDRSRVVVYRELYQPDLILSEAAQAIRVRTGSEAVRYIAASPDLAGRRQDGGKSGFDILAAGGVKGLIPADHQRIPGWRRVREFLRARRGEEAYLEIFSCCPNLLRTLPRLTFDQQTVEDAALTPHEFTHAPDALRYGLSSLPFLPCEELAAPEVPRNWRTEFFGKKGSESYLDYLKK